MAQKVTQEELLAKAEKPSKDAIWINECPSNLPETNEYSLQGVLANLARNISRRFMHLL